MKIGIVGNGVVGHATARCFLEHHEVRVNDIRAEKRTHSITEVLECDLVFVCLPSPMKDDYGGCNTHAIESFFSDCYINWHDVNFVLKSTVPVGFTRKMAEKYQLKNLVHSPEFLTARCAVTDAQLPARNIIGCNDTHDDWRTTSPVTCGCKLAHLYAERFKGIPVLRMTSDESELVKLAQNSFFATKIAFFNELRSYSDKLGLNWQSVLEGILSDGRIAHSHTQVPGPDGKMGFGGSCLPKDLNNLINCFDEELLVCPIIRSAFQRNFQIDRKE